MFLSVSQCCCFWKTLKVLPQGYTRQFSRRHWMKKYGKRGSYIYQVIFFFFFQIVISCQRRIVFFLLTFFKMGNFPRLIKQQQKGKEDETEHLHAISYLRVKLVWHSHLEVMTLFPKRSVGLHCLLSSYPGLSDPEAKPVRPAPVTPRTLALTGMRTHTCLPSHTRAHTCTLKRGLSSLMPLRLAMTTAVQNSREWYESQIGNFVFIFCILMWHIHRDILLKAAGSI